MTESEPQVYDWFSPFSEFPPPMVALKDPLYDRPKLSTPQKELIVKVMNELAIKDTPLDTAEKMLKEEVHLKSNEILAIDNVSQQLDFLAQQGAVVRHDSTCQVLIQQMRGLVVSLEDQIRKKADHRGHVDDLMLLLRGVLLSRKFNVQKRQFQRTFFSENSTSATLREWLTFAQAEIDALEQEQQRYTEKAVQHRYTMQYVQSYVEECYEALSRKVTELEDARDACRIALEMQLQQSQAKQPASKKPRVGPSDSGSLGDKFIAKLRL